MGWEIADNTYTFTAEIDAAGPVERVYPVVFEVERYPEFIPDITAASIEGDTVTMIYKAGPLDVRVVSAFEYEPNAYVRFRLKEGPLKSLIGEWRFEPNGAGTRVTMSTAFEPKLASRWLLRMTEKMLEYKTNTIMKRFAERFEAQPE